MDISYSIKPANECSMDEIKAFYSLASKAEQVETIGLLDRINNAYMLGFCFQNETLIAIAAIKRPLEIDRQKLFYKAAMGGKAMEFKLELGYFSALNHKNEGELFLPLSEKLLSQTNNWNVFATSSRQEVKNILIKLGVISVGKPYKAKHNAEKTELFIIEK